MVWLFFSRALDIPSKSRAMRAGLSVVKLRGGSTGCSVSSVILTPLPGRVA